MHELFVACKQSHVAAIYYVNCATYFKINVDCFAVTACFASICIFEAKFEMSDHVNSEDNEKPDNWKNELSTAFNEEEMFLSLIILAVFYVIYAIVKASFDAHDNSTSDEERFNNSCFCSVNQRCFYRIWFSLCCLIWLCFHSYNFLMQHIECCRNHIKPFVASCMKKCCCCICNNLCRGNNEISSNVHNDFKELASKIESNYELLWFQYCKLYVVGYTGYDDNIKKLKESHKEKHLKDAWSCFKQSICSLRRIVHLILLMVKYLSQFATVPLLFLQIFDTYSFLCFSPDSYCSRTTENKLHLLQTTITLLFYCSLGVAHLAGTLMLWDLWPKRDNNQLPQSSSVNNDTPPDHNDAADTDTPSGHNDTVDNDTQSGHEDTDSDEQNENDELLRNEQPSPIE